MTTPPIDREAFEKLLHDFGNAEFAYGAYTEKSDNADSDIADDHERKVDKAYTAVKNAIAALTSAPVGLSDEQINECWNSLDCSSATCSPRLLFARAILAASHTAADRGAVDDERIYTKADCEALIEIALAGYKQVTELSANKLVAKLAELQAERTRFKELADSKTTLSRKEQEDMFAAEMDFSMTLLENAPAIIRALQHTSPSEVPEPFCWWRSELDICDEHETVFSKDGERPDGNGWQPLYSAPILAHQSAKGAV